MSHSPGSHGLLDLYGCPPELLRNECYLKTALEHTARHIGIHTWPEHGFAAIDIFLCGHLRPEAAKETLQHALKAERSVWQTHPRGSEL